MTVEATNFVLAADAEGWLQAFPFGDVPHGETGVIQRIDQAAGESIVRNFRLGGRDVVVDFDHHHYDEKGDGRAAGYVTDMQERADGVYVKIRWSNSGLAAVQGGDYRWFSPTWLGGDTEKLGKNVIRPLRLDSLALTNLPNIRSMKPISNRRTVAPSLTDEELRAKRIANRAREIVRQSNRSVPFQKAWAQAEDEFPSSSETPEQKAARESRALFNRAHRLLQANRGRMNWSEALARAGREDSGE